MCLFCDIGGRPDPSQPAASIPSPSGLCPLTSETATLIKSWWAERGLAWAECVLVVCVFLCVCVGVVVCGCVCRHGPPDSSQPAASALSSGLWPLASGLSVRLNWVSQAKHSGCGRAWAAVYEPVCV